MDLCSVCLESTSIKEIRAIFRHSLQVDRNVCGRTNSLEQHGRLPLHCIALNQELLLQSSSNDTTTTVVKVEQFIQQELIPAYVEAIVTVDDNGRIPFTESITTWISKRRTLRGWTNKNSLLTPEDKLRMLATNAKRRLREKHKKERERDNTCRASSLTNVLVDEVGVSDDCDDDDESVSEDDYEHDLPAMVEWSLKMLSTILDEVLSVSQLGSSSAPTTDAATALSHNNHRQSNGVSVDDASLFSECDRSTSSSTTTTTRGNATLRSRLSDIANRVVQHVAAIPYLMQELLLIKDKEARARVFHLSLIHKVLFCESSLGDGTWIVDMLRRGLQHGGGISDSNSNRKLSIQSIDSVRVDDDEGYAYAEGAVFYLEAISNLNIRDDLAVQIQSHASILTHGDLRQFRKHQRQLFSTVGRLEGLIRLIVVQKEDLVNRAAVTPVIQQFLDKQIFSPLALTMTVFEGIEHVLMIACFRMGPADAMFHMSPLDTGFQAQRYLVCNMMLVSCVAFFFLKESHRAIAKFVLSKDLFWNDLGSFWNILDLLPLVLVPACIVVVDNSLRQGAVVNDESSVNAAIIPFHLRLLIALTTPLLWLRVLSHIKMRNRQLATFILCSVEIIKDIKWFVLVLFVAMSAFAQMLVSLTKEPRVVGGEAESAFDGYLKAYTLMLGDFDSLSFRKHPTITILFVFYTFGVTIVLLNILIAIVSESYSKSMISASVMLSKARLMFVARLMSANYFHQLWRRGNMISTRRNLNIVALAFGVLLSMRIVTTVKTKLSLRGQLSMMNDDSTATSTVWLLDCSSSLWLGRSMLSRIDVEAMILFVFVGGFVCLMRLTMILIQNACDDKGMLVIGRRMGTSTARSSWLDTILTYFVQKLYALVGTQIDRLGGPHETRGDTGEKQIESTSLVAASTSDARAGIGGDDALKMMKLCYRSVAASRHDIKTEIKKTTNQLCDACNEAERASQAVRVQLETKLEQLKLEMTENQNEVRSLLEASEERIVRAILSKMDKREGI